MKKILFILFLANINTFSQSKLSEVEKFKQTGLIWGLLKYHHPKISYGLYDWNLEFIKLTEEIEGDISQTTLNDKLLKFIIKFNSGADYKTKKINIDFDKVFKKNINYSWIKDSLFGVELTYELNKIKENGNLGDYYASLDKSKMMDFSNEKGMPDFNSSLQNYRLLEFYSFWNIIQYWNVNKYLTDKDWLEVLEELTEEFINATTTYNYEIAKLKMFAKLNDSHSYKISDFFKSTLFNKHPVFSGEILNDTVIVTKIYNKKLAQNDSIALKDIIVGIEGLSIKNYIDKTFDPIISSSNRTYLNGRLENSYLFSSNKNSLEIEVINKFGKIETKSIKLYEKYTSDNFETLYNNKKDHWKKIKPTITYINLDNITSKELSIAFTKAHNDKGIILDLRNYPKNITNSDLAKYLYPERKLFIDVLFPVKNNPSLGELNGNTPLKIILDPFKAGSKNSNYYKGKVVLLVNSKTGSKAEYLGMLIQQSPNCITIGEQTAGAVMNISSSILPDNQQFYFTGLGAFYPDGTGLQRQGLKIDYEIKGSVSNFDTELYINEAVKIIENLKSY